VKLTTLHQILMGSFALLGVIFALRSGYLLAAGEGAAHAALAAAGLIVAGGAALYLRGFRKRLLERRPPLE
jgi:peptidoglycan/LPS O-acetylase OafA/YrhL